MKESKISILIPTYYRTTLLQEALLSIIDQKYRDFEVIIVNDGEPKETEDKTIKAIKEITDELDYIYRYFYNKHGGIPVALNRAFSESKGDLITFMASDDKLLPDSLENRYEWMKIENADIIYTGAYIMDENGWRTYNEYNIAPPFDLEKLKQFDYINSGTLLIKREALKAVGGWDERFVNYAEDWDLLLRLAYSGYKFSRCPEFTYEYRYHQGQITNSADRDRLNNMVLERVRSGYYEKIRRIALPQDI